MTRRVYYFGLLDDGGHFFHAGFRQTLNACRLVPDFPASWDRLMDTGLLKNGRIPDQPDGRVFSIPAAGPWTAFVWWDRSGDKRPGSNSGFYVHGFEWEQRAQAFAFACDAYPTVVARQNFPLVLVERP
jgi:hypothetical protein